eukprot:gene9716-20201_t
MDFLRGLVSDMDDEIQPVKKDNKIINDNMQRGFERLEQMFHLSMERSDKLQMNMDSFQLSSKIAMEELKRRFEESESKSGSEESTPQGLTPYLKGQGIPYFEDRRSSRRRENDIGRSRPERDTKCDKEDHYRMKHRQQKEGRRDYPSGSSEELDSFSTSSGSSSGTDSRRDHDAVYHRCSLSDRDLRMRNNDQQARLPNYYLQVAPEEFGKLRLRYLTVDAAVWFLTEYNDLNSRHENMPHISQFLTQTVQEDLCAHERARRKNQGRTTHLLYSGLHNLSERVTDVHVTTPAQYLSHLRGVVFPELPDGYKNSIKNFNGFNALLGKYQLRFVTRWKFLSQETSTEFHLPLEKQGFTEGMVGIFAEKISFDMGRRILHSISREKMRGCHGSFEELLILFNEQVALILEDTHRTARVSEVIYENNPKESVVKAVETPRELHSFGFDDQKICVDDSDQDTFDPPSEQKQNYVPDTFKSRVQASEQPNADDTNRGNPRGILRTFKREQGASPGGCVCDKGELCKYKHGPEELLRETWDSYQIRHFKSPYARPKDKVLELYPEVPKVVHMASTYDEENDQMLDGLVDEIISEDSNFTNEMIAAVCPGACYTQRVHRSGQLNLITGESISMGRVRFDSGALHGNYVSKELVDKHREHLSANLTKRNGTFNANDGQGYIAKPMKMCVWSMPGLALMVGLPHILRHFLDLFTEMLTDVKNEEVVQEL